VLGSCSPALDFSSFSHDHHASAFVFLYPLFRGKPWNSCQYQSHRDRHRTALMCCEFWLLRLGTSLTVYIQLGCITTRLASSQTSLSNLSSICSNVTLQTSISACVQGKCNYTEQARMPLLFLSLWTTLTEAEVAIVNSQLCSGVPVESRAWPVAIVGLVCVPFALIAVALRCYSRYSIARKLSADDWMVIAAAALLVALVALDIISMWETEN